MTDQPIDAPEYENLRLLRYGTEPDLVAAAVTYAQAALPQWQPRAGNTEMVLLESMALILGVNVLAVQMLPGQVVEQLMTLYGVARDQGSPAKGRVRFTVTNGNPIQTIPAGTRLRYTLETTGETVDFLTTEPLQLITSETLVGEVNIVAAVPGVQANGLPSGMTVDVVGVLPFIETVVLATAVSQGTGVESDVSFHSRAAALLSRLTTTLVLPEHFQYAAIADPVVGRARVLNLFDPASPEATAPGHVTVAVTDAAGDPLEAPASTALAAALKAQALASLQVHVIDPAYTTVDAAVTVRAAAGFTAVQVQASVTAALTAWLDPTRWDWAPVVGQYAMVAKIAAAPGVAEVTTAPANIPLPGAAPLPRPGTFTVTVL
ncbi:baseplate J/gp47 family protein [Pseudarthrobacter sp. P1]|uniref:baseplate J/gp47 family protein n=1 Tax=Pseudarthrobacter sp. P1 TaxID=3418418 RepID=UPI003CE7B480